MIFKFIVAIMIPKKIKVKKEFHGPAPRAETFLPQCQHPAFSTL